MKVTVTMYSERGVGLYSQYRVLTRILGVEKGGRLIFGVGLYSKIYGKCPLSKTQMLRYIVDSL